MQVLKYCSMSRRYFMFLIFALVSGVVNKELFFVFSVNCRFHRRSMKGLPLNTLWYVCFVGHQAQYKQFWWLLTQLNSHIHKNTEIIHLSPVEMPKKQGCVSARLWPFDHVEIDAKCRHPTRDSVQLCAWPSGLFSSPSSFIWQPRADSPSSSSSLVR